MRDTARVLGKGAFSVAYADTHDANVCYVETALGTDTQPLRVANALRCIAMAQDAKCVGFDLKRTSISIRQARGAPLSAGEFGAPAEDWRIRRFLRQVLYQLADLHSKGIAHMDVTAFNVLSEDGGYRLIDYGSSVDTTDLDRTYYTPSQIPSEAVRPVWLTEGPNDTAVDAGRCDVWNLAVTTLSILTGELVTEEKPPFGLCANERALFFAAYARELLVPAHTSLASRRVHLTTVVPELKRLSPDLTDLLARMLAPTCEETLDARACLLHQYLSQKRGSPTK